MTLYEFLKRFTKRSLDEHVSLQLAGGKVYEGQMRNIPALYLLRAYTVKTAEPNWGAQILIIVLNVPEVSET